MDISSADIDAFLDPRLWHSPLEERSACKKEAIGGTPSEDGFTEVAALGPGMGNETLYGCCNGWYHELDGKGEPYFTKLVNGKNGEVLKADSAAELRRLALRLAKDPEYERGSLYFRQTRVQPNPYNNKDCKKKSEKWLVDAAKKKDKRIEYYQEDPMAISMSCF